MPAKLWLFLDFDQVHQQFDQVHEESEAKQARLNRLREEIRAADQQHVNKGRADLIWWDQASERIGVAIECNRYWYVIYVHWFSNTLTHTYVYVDIYIYIHAHTYVEWIQLAHAGSWQNPDSIGNAKRVFLASRSVVTASCEGIGARRWRRLGMPCQHSGWKSRSSIRTEHGSERRNRHHC